MRDRGQEEPAEEGVGQDLEERVEGDEHRRELTGPAGEGVPDEHHRDAAREADQDEPVAIGREVGEEEPGQPEHQDRSHDPVEHERGGEHPWVGGRGADRFVAHLREHRIHHPEEPDRDRRRDPGDLHRVESRAEVGKGASQQKAERHREEDPEGEPAVERGETREHGRVACGGGCGGHAEKVGRGSAAWIAVACAARSAGGRDSSGRASRASIRARNAS